MRNKNLEFLKKVTISTVMSELVNVHMTTLFNQKIHHKNRKRTNISGYDIKIWSVRLRTFLLHGTSCAKCGLEATHFAIEQYKDQNIPHLNLYANDMLMTCDHIHPKSKGGTDLISNTQTMCHHCNIRKSDKVEQELT